jgi:mannose-6-phosphate isomerase-like protein (cupin superfamily)
VVSAGDNFRNPRTGAELRVLRTPRDGGGAMEIELLIKPRSGKAAAHVHPDFEQHYEVLEGRATATVDGAERTLEAGERLQVPREVAHVDPWNAGDADLRLRHRATPTNAFIEAFVETLGQRMERDELDKHGNLPLLQILVLLRATRGQSYVTGPPRGFQRATLPLMAAIGRLRGYRAPSG